MREVHEASVHKTYNLAFYCLLKPEFLYSIKIIEQV